LMLAAIYLILTALITLAFRMLEARTPVRS
jgi:ABC-type arginine/histidine transport system permease subunit